MVSGCSVLRWKIDAAVTAVVVAAGGEVEFERERDPLFSRLFPESKFAKRDRALE